MDLARDACKGVYRSDDGRVEWQMMEDGVLYTRVVRGQRKR
jgi:predicted Fe-S protein YdhL (DUF1289 family)